MQYLYPLRKYILVMTAVFILSLFIGLLISAGNPGLSEKYFKEFGDSFGWIKTLNPFLIMLIIFLNNALKSLIALVSGVGFGIIPILFIAGNGIILGFMADYVSEQQGALFVFAALLPHGIIEIPIVLISAGIGLRLGHVMVLSLMGEKTNIKQEFMQSLRFFFRRIVPLLFVAAAVETFVTPLIAYRFITG